MTDSECVTLIVTVVQGGVILCRNYCICYIPITTPTHTLSSQAKNKELIRLPNAELFQLFPPDATMLLID